VYSGILFVVATIIFTVYGQLVIKWQMNQVGPLPYSAHDKICFLLSMFLRPWILTGFAAAFLASLAWMAAMTKFKLSEAYPFTSLAFVLVMLLSYAFFGEELTLNKVIGTSLVIAGLLVIVRT
jgi:multidrug transporter EmrE-like cation transporter